MLELYNLNCPAVFHCFHKQLLQKSHCDLIQFHTYFFRVQLDCVFYMQLLVSSRTGSLSSLSSHC